MSDNELLGGIRALYGFYYQLLGSLNLAVLDIYRSGTDDYSVRLDFAVDRDKTYFAEQLGQDLLIAAGHQKVLVQFKASRKFADNPVTVAELKKILLSFVSSWNTTTKSGIPKCELSGCLLITNRSIHKDAADIIEAVKQLREDNSLSAMGLISNLLTPEIVAAHQLNFKSKANTLGEIAKTWQLEEIDKKNKNAALPLSVTADGGKSALQEMLLVVLAHLHVRSNVTLEYFNVAFDRLSDSYGALPGERRDAENKLFMHVTQAALGAPISIKKQDIIRALTGESNALCLTPNEIGVSCKTSIEAWVKQQRQSNDPTGQWLFQRDLSDVLDALNEKKIVILTGPGGCGKTENLIALLEAVAKDANDNINFQGFPLARRASNVKDEKWIGAEVSRWAKRTIDTANVLTRLRLANPDRKRLLYLTIDGLDEDLLHPFGIENLFDFVRAPENEGVCLLLSCRDSEATNIIRRYFGSGGATGWSNENQDIRTIPVFDFKDNELLPAVSAALGEKYVSYFEAGPEAGRIQPGRLSEPVLINRDVRKSLAHPRMLGAWAHFRGQESVIEAAFKGEAAELRKIARIFLEFFFRKYCDRQTDSRRFNLENHAYVYQAIANHTRNASVPMTRDGAWREAAENYKALGRIEPSDLFTEAESGGLLVVVDRRNYEWSWRHSFVVDCLAEDAPEVYLQL